MKAVIILLVCMLTSSFLIAQPTISHCEDFSIGTVLKFQQCNSSGVFAGNPGAAQTWDFSSLILLPDTATESILLPSATTSGSLFPASNLVEKNSNGSFVYVHATADSSSLIGYLDTVGGFTIRYPGPMLFAIRPITYGDSVSCPYSTNFTSGSYTYTGSGISTVKADGYGKLILPTGTFNNVLRVKITQLENDTSISGASTMVTVTYAWFDSTHTSALLKIDSTQSSSFTSKSAEYLIKESTTKLVGPELKQHIGLYPNPSLGQAYFTSADKGVLIITNPLGYTVSEVLITGEVTAISTVNFPRGIYYATFQTDRYRLTSKFIIE